MYSSERRSPLYEVQQQSLQHGDVFCLQNESETKKQESASLSSPLDESFTKQGEELIERNSTGEVMKNRI